ncbi:MAG: metal-dependent transcriptional regulator [Chloroflexota bacterium]
MPIIEGLDGDQSNKRGGLSHQAIEDYLKTIYALSSDGSLVSTSQLAQARGVKAASVTGMIKRLSELKLVDYEKSKGVALTPSGEKIALEVIRHHRLIETYLIEALGFSWDEVHDQADILEHVISEKLEERIDSVLNFPEYDPHGAPIPKKDGSLPEKETVDLIDLTAGQAGQVAEILQDDDPEMLRYFADKGVRPGVPIRVIEKAPFDGPITLEIGGIEVILGYNVAKAITVELVSS